MPDQRLVFRHVIEALFVHGLADRMTPDFQARLAAKGLDLRKVLPGYDFEVWEAAILEAVSLFPELSKADALVELGRRLAQRSIDASPVAATLMPLLRVLGTAKALKRSLKANPGENYNQTTFDNETSTSLEVTMSHVGVVPEFVKGTQITLLKALGAKGGRCTIVTRAPPAATFLLEWD